MKPPTVDPPTDLDNANNSFFAEKDLNAIISLLGNETAKDVAEKALEAAEALKQALLENLRSGLNDLLAEIQNKIADNVQDAAIVARDLLEALVKRYRERKLNKIAEWFRIHADFANTRALIRAARISILTQYQTAATSLKAYVDAGCLLGLPIGVSCNATDILNNVDKLTDATIKNAITEAKTKFDNLKALIEEYNTNVTNAADFFSDLDVDDVDDMKDYQDILKALKDRRSNDLPTWPEVVDKVKNFLSNVEPVKKLVKKLWVGWNLVNDVITLAKPPVLDSTLNVIEVSFTVTIARDPEFPDVPLQEGAEKLKSVLKSLLQVYGAVDRVNVEIPDAVGVDGSVTIVVRIFAVNVNNARELAKFFQSVTVTDLTPIKTEFDNFVNGLNGDLAALSTQVTTKLSELKSQYETQNTAAQQLLADQLQKIKDFYANSSADLDKYTGNAPNLVEFAQNLVGKYLETANKTVSGLKANLDAVRASIDEADARVQNVKQQIITLVEQIQAATDDTLKATLQSALEKLKVQLNETLHDREFKKAAVQKATEILANVELRAKAQYDKLTANLADVAKNIRKEFAQVREQIKNGLDDLVDNVKNALKAYRQTVDDIQVQAGNDINDLAANSLTFTVNVVDSGVAGELDAARRVKHTALLKAIFIAITTDVDIKVTTTPKRAATDTYTVKSTCSNCATATTTPTGNTTNSAFTVAISFFAVFVGMFMLMF